MVKLTNIFLYHKIDFLPISIASVLLIATEAVVIASSRGETTQPSPRLLGLFLITGVLYLFSEHLENSREKEYTAHENLQKALQTYRVLIHSAFCVLRVFVLALIPKETLYLTPVLVSGSWYIFSGRNELFVKARPYTFIRFATIILFMLTPLISLIIPTK